MFLQIVSINGLVRQSRKPWIVNFKEPDYIIHQALISKEQKNDMTRGWNYMSFIRFKGLLVWRVAKADV